MSFEDLLRDELSDTAHTVPPGPVPYQAVVRRAKVQRRRTATGIAAGLLLLAAVPTAVFAVRAAADRPPAPAATDPGPDLRPPSPTASTDSSLPEEGLDARCLSGRVLCVAKKSNTLFWVVDGKTLKTMDARLGATDTPTREGVFQVIMKSREHQSTLHNTSMPYAMFFFGGQAIHYSAAFAQKGYSGDGTSGTVAVRDQKAIAWLFEQVREGDKVVVYR